MLDATYLSPQPIAEMEAVFIAMSQCSETLDTGIACFYTGPRKPEYCEPMARDPEYETGFIFDNSFGLRLAAAIELNPAIHDGAVIVGRAQESRPYVVHSWSNRLFPPPLIAAKQTSNRGSAFNSCLAMSAVSHVDCVYLWSSFHVWRFVKGNARLVRLFK